MDEFKPHVFAYIKDPVLGTGVPEPLLLSIYPVSEFESCF